MNKLPKGMGFGRSLSGLILSPKHAATVLVMAWFKKDLLREAGFLLLCGHPSLAHSSCHDFWAVRSFRGRPTWTEAGRAGTWKGLSCLSGLRSELTTSDAQNGLPDVSSGYRVVGDACYGREQITVDLNRAMYTQNLSWQKLMVDHCFPSSELSFCCV